MEAKRIRLIESRETVVPRLQAMRQDVMGAEIEFISFLPYIREEQGIGLNDDDVLYFDFTIKAMERGLENAIKRDLAAPRQNNNEVFGVGLVLPLVEEQANVLFLRMVEEQIRGEAAMTL